MSGLVLTTVLLTSSPSSLASFSLFVLLSVAQLPRVTPLPFYVLVLHILKLRLGQRTGQFLHHVFLCRTFLVLMVDVCELAVVMQRDFFHAADSIEKL